MNTTKQISASNEDWNLLQTFFPSNWRDLFRETGATKRLRGFKSVDDVLRILLLHVGKGYSLRETAVRAQLANIASVSDVAILKRLQSSEDWLRALCLGLLKKNVALAIKETEGFSIRIVDGTVVKEPGKTGSSWRLLYSFQLPRLTCDYFRLTPAHGVGNGESLTYVPVQPNEYIMGDRGYCSSAGLEYVFKSNAYSLIRVNPANLPLFDANSQPFLIGENIAGMTVPLVSNSWDVWVQGSTCMIPGRLCALRKSESAILIAHKKLHREASRDGRVLQPETLEFAKFVLIFTTFPKEKFTTDEILGWYRVRWQIELVFKRFKSLAQFGHVPKHDDKSTRAWLYGKLFIALLTEELICHADSISPWGYRLAKE